MNNRKTLTVNGCSYTERKLRTLARAIVRRMYGPGYRVGQSVGVLKGLYYGPRSEGVLVTVRQKNGRLSAPLEFRPE
jgi:hypothetical protein